MKNNRKTILLTLILLTAGSACTPSPIAPEPAAPTSTVISTPTTAIIPTPTPLPTLPPEQLVDEGDYALFVGDYEAAINYYQTTLAQNPDPDVAAQSRLGIGQAFYKRDEFGLALDYLRPAAGAENPVIAARANYIMARTFTRLERYQEALTAYEAYLQLRPGLIDSHVHELRGDLFTTLAELSQAVNSYEEAYRADPAGGRETLAVKIAVAYENNGDANTALSLYEDIYNNSDNDYTKAEMDLRIGRIYLERGQPEQAYAYFQDAVTNFPFTFDAYSALVNLVEAGVEVNEYSRGLVNFNIGNHILAIEAFDRYLASGAETAADAALYYKALAVRAAGVNSGVTRNEEAVALWQQLIDEYPTSEFYIDAWEDIEYTLWAYMGEPQRAAEKALTFVAQRPESPAAPDFLFLAGRSYERAGLLDEAAQAWARVAAEYPDSAEAFRSVFFAGIAQVRQGDWAAAQPLFSRALVLTSETDEIAAAHLWIGKCQEALGDIGTALDTWKVAQTADPFGHYSIRAEDLLLQRDPFTEPQAYTLDPDLTPYRLEAETWLRTTFELPPDINLESPGLLANDPRFQRGLEFWSLGDYEAGKAEFEAMRLSFEGDPAQTFRLIPALVEIGLYRSALVASTNLLRSAGLEGADTLTAPAFFSRVRFGAYYLDWLMPVAESEDLSPLLMLSLIRQESTYEGFISSSAGARGLMQIIPSTGAQLANDLDWPEDYTVADLNRPYVSLVFGSTYLSRQRRLFEGDQFAMLAAYNGGPGNTLAWKELTGSSDPDLFLEVIRIEETRNYIRLINEIFAVYRWLYGEPSR